MTAPAQLWLACAASSLMFVGVVLLLVHLLKRRSQDIAVNRDLPWWLRSAVPLAEVLLYRVGRFWPLRSLARYRALLAAEPWGHRISPELWVSLRLVHACTGACAAAATMAYFDSAALTGALSGGVAAFAAGGLWLRRRRRARLRRFARELPPYIDMLTVCIEAGATLSAGIRLIVERAPPGDLRHYFQRVLREIRSGRPRAQAFARVAADYQASALDSLAAALVHAESSGMSLGSVLRAQAAQRTKERFAAAEKLALQAPVKLLGPLILCIFPCTFIVLSVPVVVRLMEVLGS